MLREVESYIAAAWLATVSECMAHAIIHKLGPYSIHVVCDCHAFSCTRDCAAMNAAIVPKLGVRAHIAKALKRCSWIHDKSHRLQSDHLLASMCPQASAMQNGQMIYVKMSSLRNYLP